MSWLTKSSLKKAIDFIVNEIDLKEYLENNYDLKFKKYGSNFRCVCPLHTDHDPSFCISENKKHVYYCFGCKSGGTLLTFVEEMHSINRTKAIVQILNAAGQSVGDFFDEISQRSVNIMNDANEFFLKNVDNEVYRQFLRNKNYNYDFFKQRVGYSTSEIELEEYLLKKGYNKHDVWDHGLLGDKFTNTIVYPVRDPYGCISYFSCRSFGEIKYIKNDESQVTFIQDLLLGCDEVHSKQKVLLVEGNGDYHVLKERGINVLSMMGTKFNQGMIDFLKSYEIYDVIFWPDGDEGGWKFIRSMFSNYEELFCKNKINGYVYCVDGFDPDRYVIENKLKNFDEIFFESKLIPIYEFDNRISLTNDDVSHSVVDQFLRDIFNFDGITKNTCLLHISSKTKYEYEFLQERLFSFQDGKDYDYDLERIVLGGIINNINWIFEFNILSKFFFYKTNKIIFEEVKKNVDISCAIENLPDWCKKDLSNLVNCDKSFFSDQFKRLRNLSEKREMKNLGNEIINSNEDIQTQMNKINLRLSQFYRGNEKGIENIKSPLMKVVDNIVNKEIIEFIPFGDGWENLNSAISGLMPGRLILFSGNTGHGKTTIALNWIYNMSIIGKKRGLYFSGEMTYEEIAERFVSIATNIDATRIQEREILDFEMKNIIDFVKNLNYENVLFNSTMDFEKIINYIKFAKNKYKIDYVVIDYFQLIEFSGQNFKGLSRTSILKEMTARLKREICSDLNLPIILLSQLGDSALDDPIPCSRKNSETKLALSDCDVTIAMREKNKKEKDIDPNGDIIMHIDKVRYRRGGIVLMLKRFNTSLLIKEV